MDEYNCPNCGAVLNDQIGFDPSVGTWECTECGQLLMDDDVYNGDAYSGIAWYCDNCGALLNRQDGFSDYEETWCCSECGHINKVSNSQIYDSKEDYEENHFSRELGETIGDTLSSMLIEVLEYRSQRKKESKQASQNDNSTNNHDDNQNVECVTDDTASSSDRVHPSDEELRKKRWKALIFNKKLIMLDYSSADILSMDVLDVYSLLHDQGFTNIKIEMIDDIYIDSPYIVGQLEQISVDGCTEFSIAASFPYNAKIILTYHQKRSIAVPFSGSSLRHKKYNDVYLQFENLGFTNIRLLPITDLKTGWITKDGTIETVTINGATAYKKKTVFVFDVPIDIRYHTFKKR